MRLQARVEQLEAALVPGGEACDVVVVMVPAKDGRPFGTEGGFLRIRQGDLIWHRQADENEAEFLERAKAAAPPHPKQCGWRHFVADYGTSCDA